jgi:hypothetical protein
MTTESRRQLQRVSSRHDVESEYRDAEYSEQARSVRRPERSQQPDLAPRQAALALFAICFVTLGGAAAFIALWINDAVA